MPPYIPEKSILQMVFRDCKAAFFYSIMVIRHIFIASRAFLWLSGVTPAQQDASTLIFASGKEDFFPPESEDNSDGGYLW